MKAFFLLCLLGSTIDAAQNYEADSVHYTPIERHHRRGSEKSESIRPVEYFFNIQAGSLIGCNDCGRGRDVTFTMSTLHGVTIGRKLRTGVAVGFDSYVNWQTLPISGVVSWDLVGDKTKNALYIQMAYGWAHPWFIRNGAYASYVTDPFTGVAGGRMIDPSLGYRIRYYNLKMSLSVGYKFQRISYNSNSNTYCPYCDYFVPSPLNVQITEITQDMNRVQIVMTVGWK